MTASAKVKRNRMMEPTRILLLDLYTAGHHAGYISALVSYWQANQLPGRLLIAVPPSFRRYHPQLYDQLASSESGVEVRLLEDLPVLPEGDMGALGLVKADLVHGRAVRECVSSFGPDHCVLMYFDHVQLSCALDLRFDSEVSLSGIYFRPSFHYDDLDGGPTSIKERLTRTRKKTLLRLALRNPHVKNIFSLDPFVIPHVAAMAPSTRVHALPDPISKHNPTRSRQDARESWSIEDSRRLILFFGVVDRRKGILKLIDALLMLPPKIQARLSLVIAGPIDASGGNEISDRIDSLRRKSDLQIVLKDRFIAEAEIPDLFVGADLSLALYQNHLGSSNVLLRAAAAGVPVLGSEYGLIGAIIKEHQLGETVDAGSAEDIATHLEAFASNGRIPGFNKELAARLAKSNTTEHFARTIFDAVLG